MWTTLNTKLVTKLQRFFMCLSSYLVYVNLAKYRVVDIGHWKNAPRLFFMQKGCVKIYDHQFYLIFDKKWAYQVMPVSYRFSKHTISPWQFHFVRSWDEWVPEDRVLKFNDINCQKQREVQKLHDQASSKQNRKSGGTSKGLGRRSEGGSGGGGGRDKDKDSDSRASTPVALLERTPSRASKSAGSALTPTSSSDSPLEAPRKKRGWAHTFL